MYCNVNMRLELYSITFNSEKVTSTLRVFFLHRDNPPAFIMKGIFKSTKEEFKNNKFKIRQKEWHWNSVQLGSPMVMINIHFLY